MSGDGDNLEADFAKKASVAPTSAHKFNFGAASFVPNFAASEFVPGASPFQIVDDAAPAAEPVAPIVKKPVVMPSGPAKVFSIGGGGAATVVSDASSTATARKQPADDETSVPALKAAASPAAKKPSEDNKAASSTPASSQPSIPVVEPHTLTAEEKQLEDEFFNAGKPHYNVVFIGHVDAGKSTMGGHILFLTGMVDKRTMEKYEREAKEQGRESWYLSWALDTNSEERAKGKTVDYGRAYFETEKRKFTILDAPGHKNYVPSMLAGAAQADIGVLVISARRGEFETGFEKGGQTREHAMLVKTAGVKRLLVAINKMDDPTVEWSKERYDECCGKLLPFLKQVGFNPATDLDFMPISGFTGANLKDRLTKDVCPWFDGPSLIEFMDNVSGIDRFADGFLMMPLNEKYKDMGTIVSGKIESGRVRKGQNVLVMPNRKVCEVTAIYEEQDDETRAATCGDNVRIRLKGVEEEEISNGSVLCDPRKPVKVCTAFEAQLVILEHRNIICAGYSAVLHAHNVAEEVTLGALLHLVDRKTNRKSKRPPPFVKRGHIVIARLETAGAICLETYNDYQQLGRFTLRDEGKTVAMGKVTKLIETAADQ